MLTSWIKKVRCSSAMGSLLSSENNSLLMHATSWMNLKSIMLVKRIQTWEATKIFCFHLCVLFIWPFGKGKTVGTGIRSVVARDWECGQVIDCKWVGENLLEQWKYFIFCFWCAYYTTVQSLKSLMYTLKCALNKTFNIFMVFYFGGGKVLYWEVFLSGPDVRGFPISLVLPEIYISIVKSLVMVKQCINFSHKNLVWQRIWYGLEFDKKRIHSP